MENTTTNENGYAVYPACIEKATLDAALEAAREISEFEGESRVEDKDTEAVVARFCKGVRVAA